ncbi:MAG: alpha/beta fold hydrolase [Jatrophihabitans sp.]|uniref:alpha/beta fold hydrolase n=1 Tax=Jatrophihabitans sp. TaxID=1932789 RepID=UPI003F7D98C6
MVSSPGWVWRTSDRLIGVPALPDFPPGAMVDLPGRGSTFVTDTGGDKPPLVLLHALACTGLLTWWPAFDALRADHRVITFDQRWHGRGIRSHRFDLDDLADDVAALADVLGIDRFAVAGYSLGSLVGQLVAHRHGERLTGLVLAASSTHFGIGGRRLQAGFDRVAGLAAQAAVGVEIASAAVAEASIDPTLQGRWAWQQFRSTSGREIAGAATVIAGFDSRPWIGTVSTPTAVVVTRRDRLIPASRQRALAARLPDATVYEAPSGHAGVVLAAARFTPALLAACAALPTS